jgi:hypothetical protein
MEFKSTWQIKSNKRGLKTAITRIIYKSTDAKYGSVEHIALQDGHAVQVALFG